MSRHERLPDERGASVYIERRIEADKIPPVLKEYPQWLCWSYVLRGEGKKPDKRPINPRNLHNAGVHWSNTWTNFDQALAVYQENSLDGVGFVLTQDDPFVGVDLDSCVSEEGITEAAIEAIQLLQSYAEVSPSARGVRILVTSDYQENHKSKLVEVYSHSRFVTVTGTHIAGTPADINSVDPSVLRSLLPPPSPAPSPTSHEAKPFAVTDDELWRRIFIFDRQGAAHEQRFRGQTIDQDHSLTVLRLLNALARWTGGDAVRMRQMMLMSPLANNKWFSRRGTVDWLDYQIADAIRYTKGGK